MGGEALSITTDSGRAWLRETTRASILDAARSIFDEGGLDQLSLGAVAARAGFAPATVYAYFTHKADLVVAIVANDLASLAQRMRDAYPFVEAEPQQTPAEQPLPAVEWPAQSVRVKAEQISSPEVGEKPDETAASEHAYLDALPFDRTQPAPQTAPLTVTMPAVGKKRLLLERRETTEPTAAGGSAGIPTLMPHPERIQAERVQDETAETAPGSDELASLKESVAKLETRKADAWLERRLRVFEKSLGDIETRLGVSEQNASRALAVADETSKSTAQRFEAAEKKLREGLDNLSQRLEQSEKRPRGIPPDLRATINDLYARLEAIESGHKGAADLEAQWSAPLEADAKKTETPAAEPEKPMTAAAETYLTAARRAASAAAQLADIDKQRRRGSGMRKRWTRANLLVALCGALALLLVVYGFILRDYFVSQSQPDAHPPSAAHQVSAKPVSPFARLAAQANHGVAAAELLLGLDYLNGSGVAKNPLLAARWLQLAAEGGEPLAQYWFGTLYERGIGVQPDVTMAFHWYQTAATQGNRRAIYNVAIAYALGRGTARDMGQAADWFRRAAELGYVDAEYNLAVLYERGQGVPQSLADAYKWYAIAAAAGDGDSKARIAALASQLGPNEVSAAQEAAASFKPGPLNRAANLLPSSASRG